jgi:hypothetical protein
MKKFLAVFALAGVMVSCNNKKSEEKKTDADTTVVTTNPPVDNPPVDNPPVTTSGVPTFADADVNAYVQSYEDYIATYRKAAETKDMSKLAELGTKGQDLATKGTAAAQKLANNPEDAKKLADYMNAKAAELQELTKKLTGQ